ncbi:HNH endonuclease signature motif containing protein [Brevibacterium siliguriense]|uniref:HNH endonuclease signature motif containing protein n=1 Tax=Brevibacterium siliguriense TaxID=1136497 RepID=UPI001E4832E0|nr:HNH endonuclease signature motif containing protein [Brevibacterium siliguriense]
MSSGSPSTGATSAASSALSAPSAKGKSAEPTYRELLAEAGLDLTGHPLADRFDGIADNLADEEVAADQEAVEHEARDEHGEDSEDRGDADAIGADAEVSPLAGGDVRTGAGLWTSRTTMPETEEEVQACIKEIEARQSAWMNAKREEREAQRAAEREEYLRNNPQAREEAEELERESAEWNARVKQYEERKKANEEAERIAEAERTERHKALAESFDSDSDAHPLLNEYRWSDLKHIAPEVTGSIESLKHLLNELNDFARPMGPDDAVTLLDGLEALNRLHESLSIVTLSVFDRVGTPRDYGAKTTKALVQHRLNVSGQEACRRTQLAECLGRRTSISGESIEAKFPILAAALREGTLSSNQASTISKCLNSLPPNVSEYDKIEAERLLVEKAPTVRVCDIHTLFQEILGWIDPDGQEPKEAADRDDFNVNLRQMKDGTWTLKGCLDEETGGILNGLLTSRIKTDSQSDENSCANAAGIGAAPADGVHTEIDARPSSGNDSDNENEFDQEVVAAYTEVLRGDRSDCLDPSLDFTQPQVGANGEIPQGAGVKQDGTLMAMASEQPSVRRRIYERFSSVIGSIEMNRIKAGAAYALVVTAKAEDLANQTGKAVTGAEAPFPIDSAALEGLNGSLFFHLMSEKTKTMALATERRLATEKQLAILAGRDRGCTFPGCDTPPGWCEAHHIVPWAENGKTDVNNLTLACSAHHHLLDCTDWDCRMLVDGRPAWVPPATIDPGQEPVLHARFIAREIGETLFG